jgi:hypothetical protein
MIAKASAARITRLAMSWRGTSGLYYARRCIGPRNHSFDVKGEDPLDLRDMIRGWIGRDETLPPGDASSAYGALRSS